MAKKKSIEISEDLKGDIENLYQSRGVAPLTAAAQREEEARVDAKKMFPLTTRYKSTIQSLRMKGQAAKAEALKTTQAVALQNANAPTWQINGKTVNRYDMMKYIVERVAAGETLRTIVIQTRGAFPSLQTVYAWQTEHPDFKKALELAKKVQAAAFADEALDIVLTESDGKLAALARLKYDALMKRAALQSEEFRDKATAVHDTPSPTTLTEMQAQLSELLKSDPNLLPPELASILKLASMPAPQMNVTLGPSSGEEEEDSPFSVAPKGYIPPADWVKP